MELTTVVLDVQIEVELGRICFLAVRYRVFKRAWRGRWGRPTSHNDAALVVDRGEESHQTVRHRCDFFVPALLLVLPDLWEIQ